MKKYIVRFTTISGDYDKEWTYAESAEDAAEKIKHEHWNIASVDDVVEAE